MKKDNFFRGQKGVALVIALIILLVLTIIGINAISTTTYESNIVGNQRLYSSAFYTADSGIEDFRGKLLNGEFIYLPTNSGSYSAAIKGSQANISYERWIKEVLGNKYAVFRVRSEGVTPNFPAAGRVVIEAVVEESMDIREGY